MADWIPQVGQKVRLNRQGYEDLSLDSPEAHEQAKCMTITGVCNVGYANAPVYEIHVDAPLINRFLLNSSMFDPRTL